MIFLDFQSTSKINAEVLDAMNDAYLNHYGNPHSTSHPIGWQAFDKLEESRFKIAKMINADAGEVVFTSGATEANNIAIKGVAHHYQDKGKHIITMSTEHKCVLESCKFLESEGFEVTYLDPEEDGLLDFDKLKNAIRKDTILISIMMCNNETGVLQDIKKIVEIAKQHGILVHSDCAQSFGKIKIDANDLNIDLMSFSGHKIYGPQGIGALYVRKKPRVRLQPLFHGGGQERGIRSGTTPVALAVGLSKAAEIMHQSLDENTTRIFAIQNKFLNKILAIEDCFLNGHKTQRIAGCINISLMHIEGESLMMSIPNVCVSSGSACTSNTLEPSYVIEKMRKDTYYAHSAIRFGFGVTTKESDVDIVLESLIKGIERLRNISPLWHMKKNNIDFSTIQWDEH